MINLEHNIEILKQKIDIYNLSLNGICYGDSPHKIADDLIDYESLRVNNLHKEKPLKDIANDIRCSSGFIPVKKDISFLIRNALIAGFCIGESHIKNLKFSSYQEFVLEVGEPEKLEKHEQYGDVYCYTMYYFDQKKFFHWDCFSNEILFIQIGDYFRSAKKD